MLRMKRVRLSQELFINSSLFSQPFTTESFIRIHLLSRSITSLVYIHPFFQCVWMIVRPNAKCELHLIILESFKTNACISISAIFYLYFFLLIYVIEQQ